MASRAAARANRPRPSTAVVSAAPAGRSAWGMGRSLPSSGVGGSTIFGNGGTSNSGGTPSGGSSNLSAFRLASGSDLANAGVVPGGTPPFDASSYYVAAPDLGARRREMSRVGDSRRSPRAAPAFGAFLLDEHCFELRDRLE